MSGPSSGSDREISTITELKEWMELGCKPADRWLIGTEHEKFGFDRASKKPLPYAGDRGIEAMLSGLAAYGWEKVYEGDHLIALKKPDGSSVTLEPGGQLELSGAPLPSVHATCEEIGGHLREVREVAETLGQAYAGLGYAPNWSLADMPQMPKGRYQLMKDYMPTRGGRGLDMMFLSCTVQVNLDFSSEKDMVRKLRVALALQPLATALFANSPFRDGKITGDQSERSLVWLDVDADRTGMLPFVFEEGFGFDQYVDYALDVPMYFVIRDGAYVNAMGQSFRDFLKGELPALPGHKPSERDWENHLTTVFPEARVKRFIEMRGADSGLRPSLCALPAFWVGLLYDEASLSAVESLIAVWTEADRQALRLTAPRAGLRAMIAGQTLQALGRDVLDIAQAGLQRRARLDARGRDESHFLSPLHEIVQSGKSQADQWVSAFETQWQGDLDQIYEAARLV